MPKNKTQNIYEGYGHMSNSSMDEGMKGLVQAASLFVSSQPDLETLLAEVPVQLKLLVQSDFCVMSIKDAGSVGYQQYNLYGVVSDHHLVYNPGDSLCGPFARLYKKGVDSPCTLKACYEELYNKVTWLHMVLRTGSNIFGVLSFGSYGTKVHSMSEKVNMVSVCKELSRKIDQFRQDKILDRDAETVSSMN